MTSYQTGFNPTRTRLDDSAEATPTGLDVRDGSVYVFDQPTVLAVRVALATGRPLLLSGQPGSGKSSLAAFVARTMGWNYFEQVVTSRTQAQDLQWNFDAVRRLRDATARRNVERLTAYVQPRVLWWGFSPEKAAAQAALGTPRDRPRRRSRPTNGNEPDADGTPAPKPPGTLRGNDRPSVILIDEIDKADPDVPNDLLVVLGSRQFRVGETNEMVVPVHAPLVMISSNNERALPKAFLRRCVVHVLEQPDATGLVKIAQAHFPRDVVREDDLFKKVAEKVDQLRKQSRTANVPAPSTPEYLDAVRACLHFQIRPSQTPDWEKTPEWQAIQAAIFQKREKP